MHLGQVALQVVMFQVNSIIVKADLAGIATFTGNKTYDVAFGGKK